MRRYIQAHTHRLGCFNIRYDGNEIKYPGVTIKSSETNIGKVIEIVGEYRNGIKRTDMESAPSK